MSYLTHAHILLCSFFYITAILPVVYSVISHINAARVLHPVLSHIVYRRMYTFTDMYVTTNVQTKGNVSCAAYRVYS